MGGGWVRGLVAIVGFSLMVCVWLCVGHCVDSLFFFSFLFFFFFLFFLFFRAMTGA